MDDNTFLAEFHNGLVDGYGKWQIDEENIVEGEWKEDLDGTLWNGYGISKFN